MEAIPSTSTANQSIGDINKRCFGEDPGPSFLPPKRLKTEPDHADGEDQYMNDTDGEDEIDYDDEPKSDNISEPQLMQPDASLEQFSIPGSIDKFISFILSIDPVFQRHQDYTDAVKMKNRLRNINNKLAYESLHHYRLYYLPFVIHSLSAKMTEVLQTKNGLPQEPYDSYENAYVLMKEEFNNDIDYKLSMFRPKQIFDGPRAGDIFFVKIKFGRHPEDKEGYFDDQCHFGILLSSFTRAPQPEFFSTENIVLNNLPPGSQCDYMCEESVLRVNHFQSLYNRNDYHLGVHKLVNFLPYFLQAKALYMLEDYLYRDHFLNPVMIIKMSGVEIDETLCGTAHLDTIQKANDLVGQNDPSSSIFLAVNFRNNSIYDHLLVSILKQLVRNIPYFRTTDNEKTPILVIAKDPSTREHLYEIIKKDCFGGENEVILDPSPLEVIQVDKLLTELYQNHIDSMLSNEAEKRKGLARYSKSIDYLKKDRSIDDLAVHWIADMIRTRGEMKKKLLKEAKVIITDFETVCFDPQYLSAFNPKTVGEQRILCCVLVDAHNFSEIETLCLTNFSISKFILLGRQESVADRQQGASLESTIASLERSLFERLNAINAMNENPSHNSSVVEFEPVM